MDSHRSDYWANAPIEEIAKKIEAKFDEYRDWMVQTGYAARIQAAYNCFYGFNSDGTLRVARDAKEVANVNVNHYKSLIKRLHQLVTENKLAFQPRAKNSDTKSQIESDLAKGICEYYGDEKDMNGKLRDGVLGALIMFEHYLHAPWDVAEGYELTADGQQVIKSGDQRFETLDPFSVARSTATEVSPWHILRLKVNKHDTAALHPDFADEILADSVPADTNGIKGGQRSQAALGTIQSEDDEDYCYKYILYHARTPSVAQGRWVEVVAGQVLRDDQLKYDKPPIFRITAGDILSTCFGDSPAIDLLPLQEALNALFSGVVTNNLNNVIQLIWSADPNLTTRKLSDGQTLVSSASPPQALNLTGSSAENLKTIDLLINNQQLLSGVNDVARGNPGASVKTSGGQALMIAQAIQYVSDLQKNYSTLAADVASCLVSNIQRFASEEMTAYITGSTKKGQIKKFKAQDLMNVERVTCDLGNPLVQSFAGRHELVASWTQMGVMKDPKQIVSFLASGNIDQAIEAEFSDAMLIRDENEMLKKGIKPKVLLTDRHAEHILGHVTISSSPEAREDPRLLQAELEHIQEHINMMRQVPPDLAAILSGQPLPPAPNPAAPNSSKPTVQGARLPNLPQGAPPEAQANYQQALNAIPIKGNSNV